MQQTMDHLLTKHVPRKNEIQANPWDVIPIKNFKAAKQTTQIHLGDRKATMLTNFAFFPNLQILWINNNCLTSFEGLEKNFRIKHLFAQFNKIKTLENIFDSLRYIETLVIYDNELRDLDKILKCLKGLKSLKHLDLFDNPASHQPNYKMRVLYELPSLEILDRHKLSIIEKDEAVKFMTQGKAKKPSKKPTN